MNRTIRTVLLAIGIAGLAVPAIYARTQSPLPNPGFSLIQRPMLIDGPPEKPLADGTQPPAPPEKPLALDGTQPPAPPEKPLAIDGTQPPAPPEKPLAIDGTQPPAPPEKPLAIDGTQPPAPPEKPAAHLAALQ